MKKLVRNSSFIFNPKREAKIMPIQAEGYNWTLKHLECTEQPAELIKHLDALEVSTRDRMKIDKTIQEFLHVHLNLTDIERAETGIYRDPVGNFHRFVMSTSLWEYDNEYHITLAMYLDDIWCRQMHKPFRSLVIAKKSKMMPLEEVYNYANAVGKLASETISTLVSKYRGGEYTIVLPQVTPDDALYFKPSKHNPYPIMEFYGTYIGFMKLDV